MSTSIFMTVYTTNKIDYVLIKISFSRRNMHHYPHVCQLFILASPGKTGLNPGAFKRGCVFYSWQPKAVGGSSPTRASIEKRTLNRLWWRWWWALLKFIKKMITILNSQLFASSATATIPIGCRRMVFLSLPLPFAPTTSKSLQEDTQSLVKNTPSHKVS